MPARAGLLAVLFVILLSNPALASIPANVSPVDSAQGPPQISSFTLKGAAAPNLPVIVTFAIPLRNVGALDSLVTQVSDPSSPLYRHFLSPQQVKAEFLPTDTFSSLLQYVKSSGLTVEMTALDSIIVAEGTAAQFSAAFHSEVNIYSRGTSSYYISTGPATFMGAYLYASNATSLYTRPALAHAASSGGNVTFTASSFSAKDLQTVYNATSLYSKGDAGAGKTIGILDFYGSPTIAADLKLFDSTYGIPDTKLRVIPIGPYDPNLGASLGWSTEVSLDVESSHAMAPSASIDLYVANGALSLAAPLAKIVQEDNVTTLSQSFIVPEWYYSQTYYLGGPAYFAENAIIPDQYYALGSVEGISFLAASGDAGGSGYSAGPEGGVVYPASSPFVTSVGGTQTYFARSSSGALTFTQTAWSNIGFVPNLVNEGGGGGGVSILEPKPWYQLSQPTPATYPNGRLSPDLSLQAGVDPATLIVDSGKVVSTGGTSESSPLLAGLLTLVAQSAGGNLGLVNPFLYRVGNTPSQYSKGFYPITMGYTVPWTASYGYNLATGWGAPNIGELANFLAAAASSPELSIRGEILNATGLPQLDFTKGQQINLQLEISQGGSAVTMGSFTASLETLAGSSATSPLAYDSATGNWTGSILVSSESGIAYVYVTGSSGGVPGNAIGVLFAGYLGSILTARYNFLVPTDPWTWSPHNQLRMAVVATDLDGNTAPLTSIPMALQPYSIGSNTYGNGGSVNLAGIAAGIFEGNLSASAPAGPLTLSLGGGTYGYAPTVNGIYLQTSYIYPEVAAEPGSVAPGQSLTIIAYPIAPVNVYFNTAYETGGTIGAAVYTGANVSATLQSPSGLVVATASLHYQTCAQALRVCNGGASVIYGQLQVPTTVRPGLYTILLASSFGSYSLVDNLTGSFYSQILVSSGDSAPSITLSSSTLYEGQSTQLKASIEYPNGTEVKFGEYSAVVYPAGLQSDYTTIMHTAFAAGELTQLAYDPSQNLWVGNITLPSPYSSGSISGMTGQGLPYAGPFDVFVTGLSFDGTPTVAYLAAQRQVFVQPYMLVSGTHGYSSAQTSGLAFSGATLTTPASFSGDIFLGPNMVLGTSITLSSSQIQGTLTVVNSNVTLIGVNGGSIVAQHSSLTIESSALGRIELTNSTISLSDSSYASISPPLPAIAIVAPVQGQIFAGHSATVNLTGGPVSSVVFTLDGATLMTSSGGQTSYSVPINMTKLADGVHTLTVVAKQGDGLSASASVSFATDAQLQSQLKSQAQALDLLRSQSAMEIVAVAALGVVALALAAVSFRGRQKKPVPSV